MYNSFSQSIKVSPSQTAESLGSGLLPVFSTPAMIALMENTAMGCMTNIPDGSSSVGIEINVKHLKASLVGAMVNCKAIVTAIEGRKYSFQLEVTDEEQNLVGEGTHQRVLIDVEKFMSKL